MEASPTTVCRTCGTALASLADGIGPLCPGCLFDFALGEAAAENPSRRDVSASPLSHAASPSDGRFAHYVLSRRGDGTFAELGRGGVGVTYRATDTALCCEVALKVVNPDLVRDPQVRARFTREARAAAGLRHPHVASVFFFGERAEDGQLFYTMELVEGETLAARVRRCGGLPVGAVLEIGRQVADALAAAEARGLTHRDLKPANLMLVEGEAVNVKVIDFGLAKAAAGEPAEVAGLTDTQGFVGTPAFASPEQGNVWQEIDIRSDFYALGATLWFALTGRSPFAGGTLAEIRTRQLRTPPPLGQLKAARVARPVKLLLRSLLSPGPAGRPQTARELAAALAHCQTRASSAKRASLLTRVGLAAAGLVLILVGIMRWDKRLGPSSAAPEKSVAVLPFENLSRDNDNGFFTDGVQDEILTDLAKAADLKVIARSSVVQYKSGAPRDLRAIAADLGVARVLEGSVQRVGGKVRVTVQLIDARTSAHLWAEKYDRDLADVFAIQSEIAQAIAGQLQAHLSAQDKSAIQERPTSDLAAYDLYLRAKGLLDNAEFDDDLRRVLPDAIRLLDEAIALDPKFVAAYCQLARAHESMYWGGFDHTSTRFALAGDAIERAARLRPDAGEVHLARALHIYHDRDFGAALRELELARVAMPNNPVVALYHGGILRRQGRWGESTKIWEEALRVNPRGIALIECLWTNYNCLRRFDDSARLCDYLLTLDPHDATARAARASNDLAGRADLRPAYAVLPNLLDEKSEFAATVAIEVALCGRDPDLGDRALALLPQPGDLNLIGRTVPGAYLEGMFAGLRHDDAGAQAAFTRARNLMARKVADAPDDAGLLNVLGLIDAALGHKGDAIAEGERSTQLLPMARDRVEKPKLLLLLAAIYANTGEKDKALTVLKQLSNCPDGPSYGYVRLHPHWDPLRGDPRFESLIESFRAPVDLAKAPPPEDE